MEREKKIKRIRSEYDSNGKRMTTKLNEVKQTKYSEIRNNQHAELVQLTFYFI